MTAISEPNDVIYPVGTDRCPNLLYAKHTSLNRRAQIVQSDASMTEGGGAG